MYDNEESSYKTSCLIPARLVKIPASFLLLLFFSLLSFFHRPLLIFLVLFCFCPLIRCIAQPLSLLFVFLVLIVALYPLHMHSYPFVGIYLCVMYLAESYKKNLYYLYML